MPITYHRAPTPEAEQERCDEFNAANPVGTEVWYWKMDKAGAPSGSGKTTTPAQLLSGHTAVVWIEGCSGCVALSHVAVKPEGATSPSNDRALQMVLIRELSGSLCRCGKSKGSGKTFCYSCYGMLPREIRNRLYQRVGSGYEEAYQAAVHVLQYGSL